MGIKKFDLLIDWGWFYFITKPMFWLLDFIYKFVGNFGVAILCITVLVKALFFPLANRSYRAMAKMKAMQPQILALRDRFPDDKQKQQMETMALYKREKINPLSGCLPVLIQIPVFFSLYKVLVITIEMRQAPFFGWIKDLSRPDPTNVFNLFGLIPYDPTQIPVFGPYLAHWRLACHHGHHHVPSDEGEPGADRSGAKAGLHLDAGPLHLHARHLRLRPRHLLELE